MDILQAPSLVIPKLIEQNTWGGSYIVNYKHWDSKTEFQNKKIGQSYELYGDSKLALTIKDSSDPLFSYETADVNDQHSYVKLRDVWERAPEQILGEKTWNRYHSMPLLLKFTQALGNSFQIHLGGNAQNSHWKPKPESWIYMESGKLTYGIRAGTSISQYKKTCEEIYDFMKLSSQQVISKTITVEQARQLAQEFIKEKNPWQFVNTYRVSANEILDLSSGGIQHSWEEDVIYYPLGNILFEIQLDVADEYATIRSFDQGKIKDDGTIRELNIDDYFKFLDTSVLHNSIEFAKNSSNKDHAIQNSYYSLDRHILTNKAIITTKDSFHHLFVHKGIISVETSNSQLKISQGHSCFIPASCKTFTVVPKTENSTVFDSYIF